MRNLTKEKVDYRDFFNFEVCFPVFIDGDANEEHLIAELQDGGCQVVSILRDKKHPDFIRLREDMGIRCYRKAVAIIYFIKITKEALA